MFFNYLINNCIYSSKYSLLIAWCTLWCDGVTIIYSRKPNLSIILVWYQNCINKCIGANIANIEAGIPKNAAGIIRTAENLNISMRNTFRRIGKEMKDQLLEGDEIDDTLVVDLIVSRI